MATFISHSPAETQALAEEWGRRARPGSVIGLSGDLGAGKTELVKGLARGLGIAARVHSPTFNLVISYPGGRLPLHHLDLYRLETPQQIAAAGLEEFLRPEGVTVVEWAERWFGPPNAVATENAAPSAPPSPNPGLWTPSFSRVRIEIVGNTERRITYEDPGA